MCAGAGAEQWQLARTRRAAGEARAILEDCRSELGEDGWQRSRLLVSELASNAVRHGTGRIELGIRRTRGGIRVCVHDEGGGVPARRAPGDDGGYGMHLLADLADRWGVEGPGTVVWFEVDR